VIDILIGLLILTHYAVYFIAKRLFLKAKSGKTQCHYDLKDS
jgi:hypothetical protein